MRIGVDGRKIPQAAERGPLRSLDHGRELGMEGLFFRTVLEMSPTLDSGELREIKAHADELGMYLETGLGKVNPYATPEAPELRSIGDGDIRLGFERMMRACAAIDCRELWIGTANYKAQYHGYRAYDRFRTDVSWEDQLAATEKFLRVLAPVARDLGIHLNLETHEEITTFECVRLVEAVGPDALGITFDTANVVQRAEDPVAAARRIAPYVRQSHVKDVALFFGAEGVYRQPRPCGEGVVDFPAILPILAAHRPDLNLSIENPTAHVPLGGVRQPLERHRPGDPGAGGPGRAAVGGGGHPDVELAGRGGAIGVRIEVVGHGQVGAAPRGRAVDREAGDEVVDPAPDRVERDPRDRRPVGAVGGRGQHQVARRAARLEGAVGPDDVDGAGRVDLGRGQRDVGPDPARRVVEADARPCSSCPNSPRRSRS